MFQKCTKKNKVLYLRVKSNKYKRKHKQEMGNVQLPKTNLSKPRNFNGKSAVCEKKK